MPIRALVVGLLVGFASSLASAGEVPPSYQAMKEALRAGRYIDVSLQATVVSVPGEGRFLLDITTTDLQRTGIPLDQPLTLRVGRYERSVRIVSRDQAVRRDAFYSTLNAPIPPDGGIRLIYDEGTATQGSPPVELNTWHGRVVFHLDIKAGDKVSVAGRKLVIGGH